MSEALELLDAVISRENPVILDIGTNNGDDTNKFLERYPYAKVYSFEPDPRAIKKFRANVTNPRATLVEKALGDKIGTATFYQSSGWQEGEGPQGGWDMSGSIRRPTGHMQWHPWVKFEQTTIVELTTLDAWAEAAGIENIDFIWADVQGAEGDLIKGGLKTLAKTKLFYTEYCTEEMFEGDLRLNEIAALIPNFELVKVFGYDVLFRNKSF